MQTIKTLAVSAVASLLMASSIFFSVALAYTWINNPTAKNNGDMFTATDWNASVNAISELHTNVDNAQILANNAQNTANTGVSNAATAQVRADNAHTRIDNLENGSYQVQKSYNIWADGAWRSGDWIQDNVSYSANAGNCETVDGLHASDLGGSVSPVVVPAGSTLPSDKTACYQTYFTSHAWPRFYIRTGSTWRRYENNGNPPSYTITPICENNNNLCFCW